MVIHCNAFHLLVSGDTCAAIASSAGIAISDFEALNPAVGSDCAGLRLDYYVCTGIVGATTPSPTKSPTTLTTTSTSTGNGVTTPTPYESGMVTDYNAFYLVVSGDDCADIAVNVNITLDEFYTWNPTAGTSCSSVWLGYYVCVGIS